MKKLKNFRAVLIGTDGQVRDILCDGLALQRNRSFWYPSLPREGIQ